MESIWEKFAPLLHMRTAAILGDTISYAQTPAAAKDIQGFVIDETMTPTMDELDEPLGQRKRIKVQKVDVPVVSVRDRFSHPRLGAGLFKPGAAITDPDTGGRYWLMDVEKA